MDAPHTPPCRYIAPVVAVNVVLILALVYFLLWQHGSK
jgi:hypothetical protein